MYEVNRDVSICSNFPVNMSVLGPKYSTHFIFKYFQPIIFRSVRDKFSYPHTELNNGKSKVVPVLN
jgi:hypothetical protein